MFLGDNRDTNYSSRARIMALPLKNNHEGSFAARPHVASMRCMDHLRLTPTVQHFYSGHNCDHTADPDDTVVDQDKKMRPKQSMISLKILDTTNL